jgi:elongation factor G
MKEQLLDSMELERAGITIKAQAVRALWKGHQLNLIDTPGTWTSRVEVGLAVFAISAPLVVDAAQGSRPRRSQTRTRRSRTTWRSSRS